MAGYTGDDGVVYKDPCTSAAGAVKQRWPNRQSAWYVAELVSLGLHLSKGRKAKMYVYKCPRCEGWHLATCRTAEHLKRHEAGLISIRRKSTLRAGAEPTGS